MAITGVRIDELSPETSPTLDHVLPSMHEGLPSQLSVAQIVELARVLIAAQIVGGAPGQLDTLDELAAALADDANFAATITAALGVHTTAIAAINNDLPLAPVALNYIRRNAANNRYEVRTPAQVLADLGLSTVPFTKQYISPQQTITSAGSLNLTHGLGVAPKLLYAELVCIVADSGYTVGSIIPISLTQESSSVGDSYGVAIQVTSTNIAVLFSSDLTRAFAALSVPAAIGANLTNSSWKFVLKAFA